MTLEKIKNKYAISQGYGYWNELLLNNDSFTVGNLHLNQVMKIYAMECLKLASENAYTTTETNGLDGEYWDYNVVDKQSITNEKNIIK